MTDYDTKPKTNSELRMHILHSSCSNGIDNFNYYGMTANELRIGNHIHSKILKTNQMFIGFIKNQLYTDMQVSYSEIEDFEPIPLTEEWLIKLGFEKIGYNFRKVYGIGKGFGEFVLWQNTSTKVFVFKAINKLIEVNSVHHLQNSYFALTDEELTLKK